MTEYSLYSNIILNSIFCHFYQLILSNIYTLKINISSYSKDCEILIFGELCNDLTKLLPNIKVCYLSKEINHKIIAPSTCKIIYFKNKKKIKLMKQFNEGNK